jgi:hypothetical protein
MKEALSSSETSVLTSATRHNIPEGTILHKLSPFVAHEGFIGGFLPLNPSFNAYSARRNIQSMQKVSRQASNRVPLTRKLQNRQSLAKYPEYKAAALNITHQSSYKVHHIMNVTN